jgi:hypothetical protein
MNASADTVYGYPAATPKLHPCSRHLSFSCPWNRIRCGDGRVTSQVGAQGAREHLKHTHVIRKDILISSCTGTYVPPPPLDGLSWVCCIEPKGVLATAQSSKAGSRSPWRTMTNWASGPCRGASGRADETSLSGPIAQCNCATSSTGCAPASTNTPNPPPRRVAFGVPRGSWSVSGSNRSPEDA